MLKNICQCDGSKIIIKGRDPFMKDGEDDDLYINNVSGNYFQKKCCEWKFKGNLIGPQGPQGVQGAQGIPGIPELFTETPLTGEGTMMDPLRFIDGDNNNDVLIWNATTMQWEPNQIPFCWIEECSMFPNNTISSFSPRGNLANISAVLTSKGEGYIGASTTGNTRGICAIDWQKNRTMASQVASGNYSVISGGRNNTASGLASYAEGDGTTSFGRGSHAEGVGTIAFADGSHASGIVIDTGGIIARALGSTAHGLAFNNGNIIANGQGSTAFGSANRSLIQTQLNLSSRGSYAYGVAMNGSNIITDSDGSTTTGYASTNSNITTTGSGSFSFGYSMDDSEISSSGIGSLTTGRTLNGSSITNSGNGSLTKGCCSDNSVINNTANGSLTTGSALNGGGITNNGIGSLTIGLADNATILTIGSGAMSNGYVDDNAQILTNGSGAHSFGYATGEDTIINASGLGAIANGLASSGGKIISSSSGSHANGYVINGGEITSSNNGSFSSGFSDNNSFLTSIGIGSHVSGYVQNSSDLAATNRGSSAIGYAANNSTLSAAGIGSHSSGYCFNNGSIISLGIGSRAMGLCENGSSVFAQGPGSTAAGYCANLSQISANGSGSIATGYAIAGANISTSQNGSSSFGYVIGNENNNAIGIGSFVFGRDLSTVQDYSTIVGQHGTAIGAVAANSGIGPNAVIQGQASLQIGGGSNSITRDISVVIGSSVFGNPSVGGGVANFWHISGADYAEYFEWYDGNIDNIDRIGYFVRLDRNNPGKIIISENLDGVIGVTTSHMGQAGIIGDTAEYKWSQANSTDDFGRIKYKYSYASQIINILLQAGTEITIELIREVEEHDSKYIIQYSPNDTNIIQNEFNEMLSWLSGRLSLSEETMEKIRRIIPDRVSIPNPEYDESQNYVPRSARKEWIPVSLMGKVRVRDNGQCIPGDKCDCVNGIAIPGDRYYILSRISQNIIRILFK